MPITIDDATKQQTVQIDSAVVCSALEGSFSNDRVLTLRFHRNQITLDQAGRIDSKPIPGVLRVTLDEPQKEIPILNRKTLAPTGQTMSQSRLVQGITSLYHAAVRAQEDADAADAAAVAVVQQPIELAAET